MAKIVIFRFFPILETPETPFKMGKCDFRKIVLYRETTYNKVLKYQIALKNIKHDGIAV